MLLEDRISIDAPASRIFAFFDTMDRHYRDWHPDHIRFEWRQGTGVAPGNVSYFEETIAGKRMKKQVVFTLIESNRRIVFAPTNRLFRLVLPEMSFETEPAGHGSEFIARIVLRSASI